MSFHPPSSSCLINCYHWLRAVEELLQGRRGPDPPSSRLWWKWLCPRIGLRPCRCPNHADCWPIRHHSTSFNQCLMCLFFSQFFFEVMGRRADCGGNDIAWYRSCSIDSAKAAERAASGLAGEPRLPGPCGVEGLHVAHGPSLNVLWMPGSGSASAWCSQSVQDTAHASTTIPHQNAGHLKNLHSWTNTNLLQLALQMRNLWNSTESCMILEILHDFAPLPGWTLVAGQLVEEVGCSIGPVAFMELLRVASRSIEATGKVLVGTRHIAEQLSMPCILHSVQLPECICWWKSREFAVYLTSSTLHSGQGYFLEYYLAEFKTCR